MKPNGTMSSSSPSLNPSGVSTSSSSSSSSVLLRRSVNPPVPPPSSSSSSAVPLASNPSFIQLPSSGISAVTPNGSVYTGTNLSSFTTGTHPSLTKQSSSSSSSSGTVASQTPLLASQPAPILTEHDLQRDYAERSILAMFYPDEMNRYDIATTYASLHHQSIERNLVSSQLSLYTPLFHSYNPQELQRLQQQQKSTYQSLQIWKTKDKIKTLHAGIILCLNIGTEPPDRTNKRIPFPGSSSDSGTSTGNSPSSTIPSIGYYGREQGWIDPLQPGVLPAKALNDIGNAILTQYQRLQSKARYKLSLDPTIEDVKKMATSLRKAALKSETGPDRVLLHYNGHGVPLPTLAGEAWVFNPDYTQYIPLPIHDLVTWVGTPSLYIFDCDNAGRLLPFLLKTNTTNPRSGTNGSSSTSSSSSTSTPSSSSSIITLETIVLGACGADESLPCVPGLPADIFTSALTTPIKLLLKWCLCSGRIGISLLKAFHYIIDTLPGKLTEKGTPLAELQKLLITITDTIAWSTFSRPLFHRLFRQDLFTSTLYRNYLVAERIFASYNVHTFSYPALPSTAHHPLWLQFDNVLEHILMHLPAMLGYSVADMQRMERLGLKPDISQAIEMNSGNDAWGIDAPDTVPSSAANNNVSTNAPVNPVNVSATNVASTATTMNTVVQPSQQASSSLSVNTAATTSSRSSSSQPSPSGTTTATVPAQWASYFTTTNATNENDPLNLPIPQAASATASQRVLILRHRIRESRSTISTGTFTPYDNGVFSPYRRSNLLSSSSSSSSVPSNTGTGTVNSLPSATNQFLGPSNSLPPSVVPNSTVNIFANLIQNTNNYTIPSLDLRAVLGGSFFDDHLTSFATWMRTHSWMVRTKQARLIDCITDDTKGTVRLNDYDTGGMGNGSSSSAPSIHATTTGTKAAPAPLPSSTDTGDPHSLSTHTARHTPTQTNLSAETVILLSSSPQNTSTINTEPVQTLVSVPRITAPLEIPILLQCILSKAHRQRAVQLLAQFVDLGPEAVNLLLINGFPLYLSKMFDITDDFPLLRGPLILLWAKILAIDTSTSTVEDIAMKSGAITVFCRCIIDYIAYTRTVKIHELRTETTKRKNREKLQQYFQQPGYDGTGAPSNKNRTNAGTDSLGTNIPKILRKALSPKDGTKFPLSPRIDVSAPSSSAGSTTADALPSDGRGKTNGTVTAVTTTMSMNTYENNPWICVAALFCLTRIISVLPDTAIQHQSLLLTVIDALLSPLGIYSLPTHAVESSTSFDASHDKGTETNHPFTASFASFMKEPFSLPDNTIFSDHSLRSQEHSTEYRGYLQQWSGLLLAQLFGGHKLFLTTIYNEGYIAINGPHAMNSGTVTLPSTKTSTENGNVSLSRYRLLQTTKPSTVLTSSDIIQYSLTYNSVTVDRLLHHLGNSFIGVRLVTLQSFTKLLNYTGTVFSTLMNPSSSSSSSNFSSSSSSVINTIPSTHIETLGIQLAQYADQYWRAACLMHVTRKEMLILNETSVHPLSSLLLDTLESIQSSLPVSTLLTVLAQDMGTCMVNNIDGIRAYTSSSSSSSSSSSTKQDTTGNKTDDNTEFSQDMYLRGAWALAHSLIVSYGTCAIPYGLVHSTSNRLYEKEQPENEMNDGKTKTKDARKSSPSNEISFLSVIDNAMKPSTLSSVTRTRVRFILKVFAEKARIRMIKEEQLLKRQQLYYSTNNRYVNSNGGMYNDHPYSSAASSLHSGSGNQHQRPSNPPDTFGSSFGSTNNPTLVTSTGNHNNNNNYSLRKMNSSKSMLYMDMVPLPAPLPLSASIPLLNNPTAKNPTVTSIVTGKSGTVPVTTLSMMNAPPSSTVPMVAPPLPLPPMTTMVATTKETNLPNTNIEHLRHSPLPMLSPKNNTNINNGNPTDNGSSPSLLPSIRIPVTHSYSLDGITMYTTTDTVNTSPNDPPNGTNENDQLVTEPPPLDILEQALTNQAVSHKSVVSNMQASVQHDRRASSPSFRLLTSLSSPALHLLGLNKTNKDENRIGTPKPQVSSPLSHSRRRNSTRNSLEVTTPSSFHQNDTRSIPPVVLELDQSNNTENADKDLTRSRDRSTEGVRYRGSSGGDDRDTGSFVRQISSGSSGTTVSIPLPVLPPHTVRDQRGNTDDNQSKDSYPFVSHTKRSQSIDTKEEKRFTNTTPSRRISGSGSSVDTSNNVAAVRFARMKNARKQARATIIALRKAWTSLRSQTLQAGYVTMNTNSTGMITGSASLLRETCLLPWIGCTLSDGASMVRKEALITLGTVIRQNPLHEAGFTTVASASLLDFMTGGDVLFYTLLGKAPKENTTVYGRRTSGTAAVPVEKESGTGGSSEGGNTPTVLPVTPGTNAIGSSAGKTRTGPKSVEQSRYSLLRRVLSTGFVGGSGSSGSSTGGKDEGNRTTPNTPREDTVGGGRTPGNSSSSSSSSSSVTSSSLPNGGRNVRAFGLPSEIITLQSLTSVMLYSGTVFEALTENYCNPGPNVRPTNASGTNAGTTNGTHTVGSSANSSSSSSSSQLPPLSLGSNSVTKTLTQSCTRALGARGLLYLSTWLALCRASFDPVPEVAVTATHLLQSIWYRIVFTCVQSILKQLPVQEPLHTSASLSQSRLTSGIPTNDDTNNSVTVNDTKPPPSLPLTTLRTSRINAWKQACVNLWCVSPMPPVDTLYGTSTVFADAFTSMLVPLLPPLRYTGTAYSSDALTLTKLQSTTQHTLFLRTLIEGTHLAIAAYDDSTARDIVEASSRITAAFDAFRTRNRSLYALLLRKFTNGIENHSSSYPYSNDGNAIIPASLIRQMNANIFSPVMMVTSSPLPTVNLPLPFKPTVKGNGMVTESPAFGAIGTVPHFKQQLLDNGSHMINSNTPNNRNNGNISSTIVSTTLSNNNGRTSIPNSNGLVPTPSIGPLQILQESNNTNHGLRSGNSSIRNNIPPPLSLTTPVLEPVAEAIGYDLGTDDLEILPPPIVPSFVATGTTNRGTGNTHGGKGSTLLLPLTGSTDISLIQLEQQALTSSGSIHSTTSNNGTRSLASNGTMSSGTGIPNRLLTNATHTMKSITPQTSPLMKPIRPSYTTDNDRDVAMSKILQLEENGLLKRNLQLMEAEHSLQNERLRTGSTSAIVPPSTVTNTANGGNNANTEGVNTTVSLQQISQSMKKSSTLSTTTNSVVPSQSRWPQPVPENKHLTKLTGPIPPSASTTNLFALHQKERQQQYALNHELSSTSNHLLLESSSSGLLNITDESSNRSFVSLTEDGTLSPTVTGTTNNDTTTVNQSNNNPAGNNKKGSKPPTNQSTTTSILATAGSFWQLPTTVPPTATVPQGRDTATKSGKTNSSSTGGADVSLTSSTHLPSVPPVSYIPVVTEESIDQQLRSIASTTARLTPSLIARVSSANVRNIRTSARKFGQKVIFDTKVPFTNNLLFHPTREMIVSTDITGNIGFWSTENGTPIQNFSNNGRDARTIANKDIYEMVNYSSSSGMNQGTVNQYTFTPTPTTNVPSSSSSSSSFPTNVSSLRNRTLYGTSFWTPQLHQRIKNAVNGIEGYSIPASYRSHAGIHTPVGGNDDTGSTPLPTVSVPSSGPSSSSSSTLFRTGRVSGRITGASNLGHRPPLSSQAYRRPVTADDDASPSIPIPTENENFLQSMMLNSIDEYNPHPSLGIHLQPTNNNVITSLSWIDEHASCHLLTGSDDGIVRIWSGDDILNPVPRTTDKSASISSSSAANIANTSSSATYRTLNGAILPNDLFSSSALVGSSSPRLLLGIRVLPELSGSSDFDKYENEARLGIGRSGNIYGSNDSTNFHSGSSSNVPNTMDTAALSALWLPGPGQLVAAGGRSSVVRIWDITSCRCTSILHTPIESGPATCLTTAWPGTHILLAGTVNGDIHIMDTRIGGYHGGPTSKNGTIYGSTTGQYGYGSIVHTFREHTKYVVNVVQAKTGSCYAVTSGSLAADVRFWDLRAERSLAVVTAHRKGAMTSLAVHDYAPLVATGSIRRRVRILTNTGENVDQISNHESFGAESLGPVSAVAWHPSQLMLAIGAQDSIIALRKASAGM